MRLFLDIAHIKPGDIKDVTAHMHYIVHVMRCKQGDACVCVDRDSQSWKCRVHSIRNEQVSLAFEERILDAQEARKEITLAFGNIRPNRAKLVIEKCTEIGVTNFYILKTNYSQSHWCDLPRLQRVAMEAARQSQQTQIPSIHLCSLDELALDPTWILATLGASQHIKSCTGYQKVLIGPEGGWSPKEIDLCTTCGVQQVALSSRVLRSETAAIAAAYSLVQ